MDTERAVPDASAPTRARRRPNLQRREARDTAAQGPAASHPVQRLQRLMGNQALTAVVQRKDPATDEVSRPTKTQAEAKTYEQMRDEVVLKGDKSGSEKVKDTASANGAVLYEYVKQATLRSAQIRCESDTLAYDYESLAELVSDYKKTGTELKGLDPKKDKGRLAELAKLQQARGKIVNEPKGASQADFDGALSRSQEWASKTPLAVATANEDRTNIEMLYERVKKGEGSNKTGRAEAQEAKMSLDRLTLKHYELKGRVQELVKLERANPAVGKIKDVGKAGGLGFLLTVATLGIVGLEKQLNPLGYMGKGWTHHSKMPSPGSGARNVFRRNVSTREWETAGHKESNEDKAARLVLFDDLFGKVHAVKKLLGDRKGGANALDWISGILFYIGDGVVQSLITLASRVGIWLGIVTGILFLANMAAHGALSPVVAILGALVLAITYVRLALAALKLTITGARMAVDSLNLAINNDPRMTGALQARTTTSGAGVVGDAIQLGGTALMGAAGGGWTNPFSPVGAVENVGQAWGGEEKSFGQQAGETAGRLGGAAIAMAGAEGAKPLAEIASKRTDLYNAEHRYLGGSNPASHAHKEGAGYQGPQQGPSQPNWLSQGILAQEKQKSQGADYLKKTTDVKLAATSSALEVPADTTKKAADTAKATSEAINSAKDTIAKAVGKDATAKGLPPDAKQQTDNDAKDTKALGDGLGETAKVMQDVATVAKDGTGVPQSA